MDVLVIDDDEHVRAFVKRALERAGHTVHLACDGTRVRQLLRTLQPDVVLTDVFMPDVDGFEALTILRQSEPGMPVVVMSGGAVGLDNCLRMAEMLGAAAVLHKPLSTQTLLDTLSTAVAAAQAKHD